MKHDTHTAAAVAFVVFLLALILIHLFLAAPKGLLQ
jgi:hypothetical protein